MSPLALSQIGILFAVALVGHLLIKAAGLGLPKSRTASESFWRVFWVYQPDIPRDLIRKHHLAHFLVFVIACIAMGVYRANVLPE